MLYNAHFGNSVQEEDIDADFVITYCGIIIAENIRTHNLKSLRLIEQVRKKWTIEKRAPLM